MTTVLKTAQAKTLPAAVALLLCLLSSSARGQQGYVAHFEGEDLVRGAESTGGRVWSQPMQGFGPGWSGNRQLSWVPPQAGGQLHLSINVRQAGNYRVAGYFTKANNCGIFQAAVNGAKVGGPVDAYDPGVVPSGRIEFGQVTLRQGANTVTFHMLGKSPRSQGWVLGIDGLAFDSVAGRPGISVPPRGVSPPRVPEVPGPIIQVPQQVPQQAVPPRPIEVAPAPRQPPPRGEPQRPTPKPERLERVDTQADLLVRVELLKRYLDRLSGGAGWREYLALDDLKRIVACGPPEEQKASAVDRLRAIAERFEQSAAEPKYADFHAREELRTAREALSSYVAKLPDYPPMPEFQYAGLGRMRTRVPVVFRLHPELLKTAEALELKVWNGHGGDFRFYVDSVFVAADHHRASTWDFRWKNGHAGVDRAVWQACAFEPSPLGEDWENPSGLLATGDVPAIPKQGSYGIFSIDLVALAGMKSPERVKTGDGAAAAPGPAGETAAGSSAPTAAPQARAAVSAAKVDAAAFRLAPMARVAAKGFLKLPRRDFFIRLVALDAGGEVIGFPTPAVRVTFGQPEPSDFRFTPEGIPMPPPEVETPPSVRILEFAPIRWPTSDHWIVTGENHHGWPIGKKVYGDIVDLVKKSDWQKFKDAVGDVFNAIKSAVDWVAEAYEDIKAAAVSFVANDLLHCGNPCVVALSAGLDYGLMSIGLPPELPDFNKLVEMGKGNLKEIIAAEAADLAAQAGVPAAVADRMTKEVTDRLVDRVAAEIKNPAKHASGGFWLQPDPDYDYRPAYVRVVVHNPATIPYSGTVSVTVKNERIPWHRVFQGSSVPVPNLRPGESREIPLVLEEDADAYYKNETQLESENRRRAWKRWWDNYEDPDLSLTLTAGFHGQVPLDRQEEPDYAVFSAGDSIPLNPKAPYRAE